MAADRDQRTARFDDRTPVGISVAVGCLVMVGVSLLAAAVFTPSELAARAGPATVAVGGYAAVVADPRAVLTVTALSLATYVGFLAHRFGELTGSVNAWSYASIIGLAAGLGAGYRRVYTSAWPEGSETDTRAAAPDDPTRLPPTGEIRGQRRPG